MPTDDREFYVNLNMMGQEIKNVKVENLDSVPADATLKGRIIFLTTDNTIKYADGTAYKVVATTDDVAEVQTALADYIPTAQKGVADGVATLGSDAKVPVAQLLTGNVANAVVILNQPLTNGQVLQWNGTGFVGYSLASAVVPRGSVATYDALPALTSANVGDMYNVEAEFQIEDETYPAGTNVVCVLGTDSQKAWDPMSGFVDLSGYQVSALVTTLSGADDTHYPSAKAVSDAIATAQSTLQTAIDGKVTKLGTGPTAGTYTKVTINADGLVTAGANLQASDIPDISATYVKQTQIGVGNGLIPTVAGTGTAGQVIAVNAGGNGFEFKTIAVNPFTGVELDITADGSQTSWVLLHGLGAVPKTVQVFKVADGTYTEIGTAVSMDATNVTITTNVALPAGSYKVTVTGRNQNQE